MDLLKQLETKIQTLVQQRNQLAEELEALKSRGSGHTEVLTQLQAQLAKAEEANATLLKEREGVRDEVAALIKSMEALG